MPSILKHVLSIAVYMGVAAFAAGALTVAGISAAIASAVALGGAFAVVALHLILFVMLAGRGWQRRLAALEAKSGDFRRLIDAHESELADMQVRLDGDVASQSAELASEMRVLRSLLAKLDVRAAPLTASSENDTPPKPPVQEPEREFSDDEVMTIVRQAVESNRIDLYLQPIVALPSRKVTYYEAFSRLRDEAGTILYPGRYLPLVQKAGMISLIDNLLMFRCVQVVRQLQRRRPDRHFFVNVSAATLRDEAFIVQFMDFMEDHADLAERIILEIGQPEVNAMDGAALSRLEALADMNFRFSMDHVTDLDIDFHALGRRHFKFVKIAASVFFGVDGPIHKADYNEAVRRSGMQLILEKIEDDTTLVELLDHDVELGQGYLFGAPRRSSPDAGKGLE